MSMKEKKPQQNLKLTVEKAKTPRLAAPNQK